VLSGHLSDVPITPDLYRPLGMTEADYRRTVISRWSETEGLTADAATRTIRAAASTRRWRPADCRSGGCRPVPWPMLPSRPPCSRPTHPLRRNAMTATTFPARQWDRVAPVTSRITLPSVCSGRGGSGR
jgi:hypothetical protein